MLLKWFNKLVYKQENTNDKRKFTLNFNDYWLNFQIDHFKPISKYPELERNYKNLVYCCSYVNRAKSDDLGLFICV